MPPLRSLGSDDIARGGVTPPEVAAAALLYRRAAERGIGTLLER